MAPFEQFTILILQTDSQFRRACLWLIETNVLNAKVFENVEEVLLPKWPNATAP